MTEFTHDGLTLHYVDKGEGAPVVLLHGFGMSAQTCWVDTGLVDLLVEKGYRVLALDARGHGKSDKPTDISAYDVDRMNGDVAACMQHAGVDSAPLVGHSMGGRTVLTLLTQQFAGAKASVVVSNGSNVFQAMQTGALADALESGKTDGLPPPVAGFVQMVVKMGNDVPALAAYLRNPRPAVTPEELTKVAVPVKVVCGDNDPTAGEPQKLCEAMPNAELLVVPGREHTDVLYAPELHEAVLEWIGKA